MSDLAKALSEAIAYDWRSIARPEQLALAGDWNTWLILAGRGFGKTGTGAEWVRESICGKTPLAGGRYKRIALIAETASDARDVMTGDGLAPGEGSGIIQVHEKSFRPVYEPSKRRLTWPNGATASLFNGTEPDQLRGPQFDAAWLDELAKYRYANETWAMLSFGLRLGANPRALITTTPKPLKLLKAIIADPGTAVTRGKTLDNAANLASSFLSNILRRYQNTRLGLQELDAILLVARVTRTEGTVCSA
jgi:phage terminase large subunit-like protein